MKTNTTQETWEARAERVGRQTTHFVKMPLGSCYLTRGVGETDAQVEAKARLIAAAPESLKALERLADEYESLRFPDGASAVDATSPLSIARAAIAKATACYPMHRA